MRRSPNSEAELSRTVKAGLGWLGYTVLDTSEHRSFCPTCGTKGYRSGQDKGLPDLLVRKPDWPIPACWIGIELKRPVRWRYSSPEQRALCESGANVVCTSWEEALGALERMEKLMSRLKERP